MTAKSTPPQIAGLALHRRWVLWYDNPRTKPEGIDWKENLKQCGSFSTAEEFWEVFNNVKPASQLNIGTNYHIFVDGVTPMWEDPANQKGGKFVLTMQKRDSKAGKCDEWWLFTALAIIGETMDKAGNEICGAVVSIRKSQDRIALWLKSCDREACVQVGLRWKKALEVSNKTSLKYHSHKAAAASGHSFKNEVLFDI
mmetsp:Transcript_3824/g.5349  ORF Transcript_3824/g.5349 Transcript_3824/m.5349 type:complete len:198 (-) Transcript_3824:136-729(-)|eukprot:CAMPEP_0197745186 /NCGR_PEP_ID=MMETSP1435-20131217/41567_1 /TAXON_ID=426625 /ORGANISM="Chaetoceros brevis, Strain CCMP164" /LENGTH=197 /DNA_ID=CAMNT_0043336845 /DNA_START=89 /DNA_END=682 /DNA_ORIENTATION=-